MNTLVKLIASIAALIVALALAWVAWHGVTVNVMLSSPGVFNIIHHY
jgi:hypothetical protein